MGHSDNFEIFMDALINMPFHKTLTLTPESFDLDNGCIRFSMRDELVGNPAFRVLHGGVTSAILDLEGALVLGLHHARQVKDQPPKSLRELYKGGTLDLRIDFIQPGKGRHFVASGKIVHIGKKVAITHSELHNDQQQLIAMATGSYVVG
ncbi:MAG: thioesterase family protein [Dehalococcoidia bacterium]|nr:thioesterase family protein [Dehalococcoidia bacterium]